jgi:hypothetical protein
VRQTQSEYVAHHRLQHSERRSPKIFGVCDRTVGIGQSVILVLRWILFLCKQVFEIKRDTITVLRDLHGCCTLLLKISENVKAPEDRWSGCSSQCMSFGFSEMLVLLLFAATINVFGHQAAPTFNVISIL